MRRGIVIGLVVVAAVAGLLYAAHTLDLVGQMLRMHAPPFGDVRGRTPFRWRSL